jgi:hypothetical protein
VKSEMPTLYETIYNNFLSKINDVNLVSLPENISEATMYGFMISAVTKFTKCKNNLQDRDDTLAQFNPTLTDFEIEVIANMMVAEWLSPSINNITVLKQVLSDSDFKISSQAQHLKELLDLKTTINEEISKLLVQYSYDNYDFTVYNCY